MQVLIPECPCCEQYWLREFFNLTALGVYPVIYGSSLVHKLDRILPNSVKICQAPSRHCAEIHLYIISKYLVKKFSARILTCSVNVKFFFPKLLYEINKNALNYKGIDCCDVLSIFPNDQMKAGRFYIFSKFDKKWDLQCFFLDYGWVSGNATFFRPYNTSQQWQ